MESWRLLTTWSIAGHVNMAIDEAIAQQVAEGESPPTVRFYTWNPYTISLGYNQKTKEINYQSCKRDGIGLVRRPTGGRAILHAEELTYAVIFDSTALFFRSKILETYLLIARALVTGVRRLGIGAELVRSNSDSSTNLTKPASRFLCFSTASAFEIVVEGRKLIGSAQRRWPGVVLQHGSLLLGHAHLNLPYYLNLTTDEQAHWRKELEASTICLKDILQHQPTILDVVEAITAGFEQIYGIQFHKSELSPQEQSRAAQLLHKYQREL